MVGKASSTIRRFPKKGGANVLDNRKTKLTPVLSLLVALCLMVLSGDSLVPPKSGLHASRSATSCAEFELLASLMTGMPASVVPVPRQDPFWQQRYGYNVQEAASQSNTNLLFMGDSITQFMDSAHDLLQALWGMYQPLNLGIAGDRTQNVLWRIECGQELTKLVPRVAVVLIGTNNLGDEHDNSADVVAGITAVVEALHTKLPTTKIVVLGILPRGAPQDPFRAQITAINQKVSGLADNQHIWFADVGSDLLQPDGTISPATMPDGLHPSHQGYDIIFSAISGLINKLEQ
jgi:lysophospholipase L1-like esterase